MSNQKLSATPERWDDTDGYEMYVGRWSKLIGVSFIDWLNPKSKLRWLEMGCGTGALTKTIVEKCQPSNSLAVDKSDSYLKSAKGNIGSGNVSFLNAELSAHHLSDEFDHITSGLVINFVPQVRELLKGLMNNLKNGGQMSSFVWDYGGHYQPMRHFWDAAKEVASGVEKYDSGIKFEICKRENLIQLFKTIGLTDVQFTIIEHIATFRNFDDYWLPIASAQGSVTEFISILTDTQKDDLKANIERRLPIAFNGEVKLIISALAVKGIKKQ